MGQILEKSQVQNSLKLPQQAISEKKPFISHIIKIRTIIYPKMILQWQKNREICFQLHEYGHNPQMRISSVIKGSSCLKYLKGVSLEIKSLKDKHDMKQLIEILKNSTMIEKLHLPFERLAEIYDEDFKQICLTMRNLVFLKEFYIDIRR